MATRLEQTQARLDQYYTAESKILEGQAYSIGSRNLTRANLGEVQDMIKTLENKVDELTAGDGSVKRKSFRILARDV